MALTYSKMLDLGTKLPDFELTNTIDNKKFNSNSLSRNKGKVIMFICNHCPYVIHSLEQIIAITDKYLPDVEFVAISSNDVVEYPEDSPQKMKELAKKLNFHFPIYMMKPRKLPKNTRPPARRNFIFLIKIIF